MLRNIWRFCNLYKFIISCNTNFNVLMELNNKNILKGFGYYWNQHPIVKICLWYFTFNTSLKM